MSKLLALSLLTITALFAAHYLISQQNEYDFLLGANEFPKVRPDYFEFNMCLINYKCHSKKSFILYLFIFPIIILLYIVNKKIFF